MRVKGIWLLPGLLLLAAAPAAAIEAAVRPTLVVNAYDQYHGTPPGQFPYLPVAGQVSRFQPFRIELTYRNAALKENRISVKPRLRIRHQASGQVIYDSGERLARDRFFQENPELSMLSKNRLEFAFDVNHPAGAYDLLLTTVDEHDDSRSRVMATITLLSDASLPEADKFDLSRLTNFYYRDPVPELAVPALKLTLNEFIPEVRRSNADYSAIPMLAFYYQIFRLNPQLHDELLALRRELTGPRRRAVGLILAALGRSEADAEDQELLRQHPLTVAEVETPDGIDLLWAEFFATGRKAPLQGIVGQLKHMESGDGGAKLLALFARRSLEEHAVNHELIRLYLEAMLAAGNITTDQVTARQAAEILAAAEKAAQPHNHGGSNVEL